MANQKGQLCKKEYKEIFALGNHLEKKHYDEFPDKENILNLYVVNSQVIKLLLKEKMVRNIAAINAKNVELTTNKIL